MHAAIRTLGLLFLLVCAGPALAAEPVFPDRARAAVVDAAAVIPDEAEAALARRIVEWNRATGHQLVVATVPSLQGLEVQDYATRLLRHWGLGRAGAHDGILLLLAPNERQIRIEAAYGVESVLTDALSGRIIHETIRPKVRAGDVAGALDDGVTRIMAAVAQADGAAAAPPQPPARPFPWLKWLLILVGLGFLLLFLWPVFELWVYIWPFYVLMPARVQRTKAGWAAEEAEANRRENDRRRRAAVAPATKTKRSRGGAAAAAGYAGSDALAALRDRAESNDDSGSSYDGGGGAYDSGFDSGGGSSGGGGADESY
jgi:uncharacterized protein